MKQRKKEKKDTFATFVANMSLLSRVYDKVQSELFLPLEGLHADRANVRSLRVVRLLVTRQVIFAF